MPWPSKTLKIRKRICGELMELKLAPKMFDQLIVNLKAREEHGVIPPKFVFPLVLEACANVDGDHSDDAMSPSFEKLNHRFSPSASQ